MLPAFEGHAPDGRRSPQAPAEWPFGTLSTADPRSEPVAPITGLGGPLTPDELAQMLPALF